MSNLKDEKSILRKSIIKERDATTEIQRQIWSQAIKEHTFSNEDLLAADSIGCFYPFGSEVDTIPIIDGLSVRNKITSLPVVREKNNPLVFLKWKPGDEMVLGAYNIPRPPESAEICLPDVLLVPLVAIDRFGYRLGYGGGFYDRTVASLRLKKPVRTVGIAFSCQMVEEVPRDKYDIQLDMLISEDGIHKY